MALYDVFLLCFEAVSELRVNLSKTELVPTGEVECVMKLGLVLGFRVVTTYGIFGITPGLSFTTQPVWKEIFEKVKNKLASWNKQYLSKGGMITLIKSTFI